MAPRKEARIFVTIWDDPDFVALAPGPQRMFMHLLSQKDLSYCGVIPLREKRWAKHARGLTPEQVSADLEPLAEPFPEGLPEPSPQPPSEGMAEPHRRPLIVIDEDTGELLVRSLIRLDGIWKIPNLLKAAMEAATLVESPTIKAVLADELRRLPLQETESSEVRRLVKAFIDQLDTGRPKGSPDPSRNPSAKGSPNPSANPSGDPSAKGSLGERGIQPPVVKGSPNPPSPEPRGPHAHANGRATPLGTALLEEHMQASRTRPPRRVLARTGEAIDTLLDEGIDPDHLRAGLNRMRTKNLGPALLADLVHEARNAPTGPAPPGRRPARNTHPEHDAGTGIAEGFG